MVLASGGWRFGGRRRVIGYLFALSSASGVAAAVTTQRLPGVRYGVGRGRLDPRAVMVGTKGALPSLWCRYSLAKFGVGSGFYSLCPSGLSDGGAVGSVVAYLGRVVGAGGRDGMRCPKSYPAPHTTPLMLFSHIRYPERA